MYVAKYVKLAAAWHPIAENEQTECGIAIPYPGTPWASTVPEGESIHCGPDATKAPAAPAKPKAKKK